MSAVMPAAARDAEVQHDIVMSAAARDATNRLSCRQHGARCKLLSCRQQLEMQRHNMILSCRQQLEVQHDIVMSAAGREMQHDIVMSAAARDAT